MPGLSLLSTGGTFSMGRDLNGLLVPMFDLRHYAVALYIQKMVLVEEKRQELFDLLIQAKDAAAEADDPLAGLVAQLSKLQKKDLTVDGLVSQFFGDALMHEPYFIDSIEFDFDKHYSKLRDHVVSQLENDNDIMIIGGTDSLEFYAQALARDPKCMLARRSYPNRKVVFLSSMLPFGDNPLFIAHILNAALVLVKQDGLAGFYMMSANDDKASSFAVYDLAKPIVKISSSRPDAFRGMYEAGTVCCDGTWKADPSYKIVPFGVSKEPSLYRNVAPPLICGNTPGAVTAYLKSFPNHDIVIEGGDLEGGAYEAILALIQERAFRGVNTFIVNDHRYSYTEGGFFSILSKDAWEKSSFCRRVKEVGAILCPDTTTTAVYLDAIFAKYDNPIVQQITGYKKGGDDKRYAFGVRYIPNSRAFDYGLKQLEAKASHIVISALPGGVLPESTLPCIQGFQGRGIPVSVGFTYTGMADGMGHIEKVQLPKYAAARAVAEKVTLLTDKPPSVALDILNVHDIDVLNTSCRLQTTAGKVAEKPAVLNKVSA